MITAHGVKPRPRNRSLAHTGECLLGSYGHDNTDARALSNHADRAAPDSRPLCVGNGPVELGINSIRLDVTAFEKFGSRLAVIDHADVLFHGNRCGRTRSRRLLASNAVVFMNCLGWR